MASIHTGDRDRALAFYGTLGFTETFRVSPEQPDRVELRFDDTTIA